MFGYVKAFPAELKLRQWARYRAYYCGVCKAMKRYTLFGRALLSYDCAFFALLTDVDACCTISKERCGFKIKKLPVAHGTAVNYAAALNIILACGKARDDMRDKERLKGAVGLLLKSANRKAGAGAANAGECCQKYLSKLWSMEESTAGMDAVADCFASMCAELCACAPTKASQSQRRILHEIGYAVGRWVYLIDAVDDMQKDGKRGAYNPVINSYKTSDKAVCADKMEQTLLCSLNDAHKAAELLPDSLNKPIVLNIIDLGLQNTTAMIIRGETDEPI